MMGRETVRNLLEFYSKNKFEKLVHLVSFIIRSIVVTDITPNTISAHEDLWGEIIYCGVFPCNTTLDLPPAIISLYSFLTGVL